MLYIVSDILVKVALISNKYDHHVIRYNDILLNVALNTNKTEGPRWLN